MKTKTFVTILIPALISIMIFNGCATTTKVKEPKNPDSTLLIGRIGVNVMGFQGKFSRVNGVYTDRIKVYLINATTEEFIELKSGPDGLFGIIDLEPGPYVIAGFEKFIKKEYHGGALHVNLSYANPDYPYFYVTDGCVNNLGYFNWNTRYSYTKRGLTRANLVTTDWLALGERYDAVEKAVWSKNPESAWLDMKWIDIEVITNE